MGESRGGRRGGAALATSPLLTNHEHLFVETPEGNLSAGGLLVGSCVFVDRMRHRLRGRSEAKGVPALRQLRPRPSLDRIVGGVARHFGCDAERWSPGRRSDDAARALAAYLARSCFGYRAAAVAQRLGYRGPSSVSHAVRRIERAPGRLRKLAAELEAKLRCGLFTIQAATPISPQAATPILPKNPGGQTFPYEAY